MRALEKFEKIARPKILRILGSPKATIALISLGVGPRGVEVPSYSTSSPPSPKVHLQIRTLSIRELDVCFSMKSKNQCDLPKARIRSKSPSAYRKPCDLCHAPNDVLVRCTIDDTSVWFFVCTKNCWRRVSGGEIDGTPDHPYYRYGGMWKNKHAGVSAKKPKPEKPVALQDWQDCTSYVFNDKVTYEKLIWICRRSHTSSEVKAPGKGYSFWKETG